MAGLVFLLFCLYSVAMIPTPVLAVGSLQVVKDAIPPDGTNNHFRLHSSNLPIFERQWGSFGLAEGQFDTDLWHLAVDATGNVYIADTRAHRIQKFDSSGNFLFMWGWGVDDGANAFQKCTAGCQEGIVGDGDGQFWRPIGVALDELGNIYVTDAFNYRVQKFDSNGNFLRMWGWGVADGSASFQTCTNGCQVGLQGGGDGQFDVPIGVAVHISGNVYVTDFNNDRIQVFDSTGSFVMKWGTTGTAEGQIINPRGIDGDSDGNVYITEGFNRRVQKFDAYGNFLRLWGFGVDNGTPIFQICTSGCRNGVIDAGGFNDADGQLEGANGIDVDEGGNVYVADEQNSRIQVFDADGTFLKMFGWGVSDGATAYQVCTSGCQRGISGYGDGQFFVPRDIATDHLGNIYVSAEVRVQKLVGAGFLLDDASPDDGDTVSDAVAFLGIPDGNYSVTEITPAGWLLQSGVCTGSTIPAIPITNGVSISVGTGDNVTCTFANVPDTDGDGIADSNDPDDDNDGLPDTDETTLGLDPKDSDSDNDGTLDGDEDNDNDGANNLAEVLLGFDPIDDGDLPPQSFADVPRNHAHYLYIQILANDNNLVEGCGDGNFCPDEIATRDLIAIWLDRAANGGGNYTPPIAGFSPFTDVSIGDSGVFGDGAFGADYIVDLFNIGGSSGCTAGDTLYCPTNVLTKVQMAIMALNTKEGAGYTPPTASGTVFDDVSASDFGVAYMEEIKARNYSHGCDADNYCPNRVVSKAGLAKVLAKTFDYVPAYID